ncbi:MAG: hypothetical protein IJS06_03230 [Prevotella sp.]|jgi:hypothetical protein|nr:hypothetical protein [Prevotella sp.]
MHQRVHSIFISRALSISVLLLMLLNAHAQGGSKKNIIAETADSIPLFRGVAVSVDLVGPAEMMFGDYGQYEAAARINLKDKYFPVVELGWGKANAEDVATQLTYKTNAPYVRAGMDFNLMKNKHDIYRLLGGVRYAYTSFKYDVNSPNIVDPVWKDNVEYNAEGVKCNYHWLEFSFGVDAKIWGPVRMGWTVRYRKKLYSKAGDFGTPWYVPGFGKSGSTRLGGTFNVTFEL